MTDQDLKSIESRASAASEVEDALHMYESSIQGNNLIYYGKVLAKALRSSRAREERMRKALEKITLMCCRKDKDMVQPQFGWDIKDISQKALSPEPLP